MALSQNSMRFGWSTNSVTIQSLFVAISGALNASMISDSDIEAEVLIRHALAMDRAQYFASLTDTVSLRDSETLQQFVALRLGGEPLSYITGTKEFYGLEIAVNHNVLIPRQETELVVDLALDYIGNRLNRGSRPVEDVADVCTGSGAIGVAVAVNCDSVKIVASDIDSSAIEVAEHNFNAHGVADKALMVKSDLMEKSPGPYDLILCNPPYIPTAMLTTLAIEVQNEPVVALDGGVDGLGVFRRLMIQSKSALRTSGAIIVELMPEQMEAALGFARNNFPGADVERIEDLAGNPRALTVYQEA